MGIYIAGISIKHLKLDLGQLTPIYHNPKYKHLTRLYELTHIINLLNLNKERELLYTKYYL